MRFFFLKLAVFVAGVCLSFNFVCAVLAAVPTTDEKNILEKELIKLEKQIAETEAIISDIHREKRTLKGEINRFDKEITKTNLQIRAINLEIQRLDGEIKENQNKVVAVENLLDSHKKALRSALQNIYEQETETVIEILLQSSSIASFFAGVNGLLELQESLQMSLEETAATRDQLLDERESLALKKTDETQLKSYRDSKKNSLQTKKKEKKELLKTTQGKESKYQELLTISKKTAAQIRNRIFEFLGGGQLTFEQAYKLAKSAGDVTGMRPAMILAVLDKESALGYNVGRCNYKESMHPRRDIPVFLDIMKELNINPDSVMVSCANRDGAYGGAMGPAQFIPSTWKIYKDRIANLTGSNPPSPWSNFDAFTGTGLYLKDARSSRACRNYSKEIPSQEAILLDRCAAAKYYAGGRWRRYRWTYGERVIKKARQFEGDIARINS